jgi:hypothetical protein
MTLIIMTLNIMIPKQNVTQYKDTDHNDTKLDETNHNIYKNASHLA